MKTGSNRQMIKVDSKCASKIMVNECFPLCVFLLKRFQILTEKHRERDTQFNLEVGWMREKLWRWLVSLEESSNRIYVWEVRYSSIPLSSQVLVFHGLIFYDKLQSKNIKWKFQR